MFLAISKGSSEEGKDPPPPQLKKQHLICTVNLQTRRPPPEQSTSRTTLDMSGKRVTVFFHWKQTVTRETTSLAILLDAAIDRDN